MVWTGIPDGRDPIIAEVLVRDDKDVEDMDVTVDSSQAVSDVIEDRSVVAMVGLDAMQMGEDWEDPCDLVYAEYMERYNLDAPEGMELLVFERLKGPDESVMMVGEVTGLGHVHQTLSISPLLEADIVCTEPVADILTVMHDVPDVAGSLNCRSPSEAYGGGGAALYYEGDISDSDCGSVEDREKNTWEEWCDSAFRNGYGGFSLDTDDPLPPVVFSGKLFWDEDIAEPSRMRTIYMYQHCRFSWIRGCIWSPPPDTDGIVQLNNNE